MPAASETLTKARREEIINACAALYETMGFREITLKDIGVLASLDPVAIDQACIDLVMHSDDPGREHFMERVNSRNGIHTIEAAADLGIGSREYELIEL